MSGWSNRYVRSGIRALLFPAVTCIHAVSFQPFSMPSENQGVTSQKSWKIVTPCRSNMLITKGFQDKHYGRYGALLNAIRNASANRLGVTLRYSPSIRGVTGVTLDAQDQEFAHGPA
jgi:hypothetical protein